MIVEELLFFDETVFCTVDVGSVSSGATSNTEPELSVICSPVGKKFSCCAKA